VECTLDRADKGKQDKVHQLISEDKSLSRGVASREERQSMEECFQNETLVWLGL